MFKHPKEEQSPHHSPISSSSSPQSARNIPTIVSADTTITGTISGGGDIQIDGTVNGDVVAEHLVVGENAKISGEIVAENLEVRGTVTGSIRANNVRLTASAHFEGDVLHSVLSVESGAHFDGKCKFSENPMAEFTKGDAAAEKLNKTDKATAKVDNPDIAPREEPVVKTGVEAKDTTKVAEKFAENLKKKSA
jgi:cytoskeletal protein CcmA (bactofilin family)